MLSNQELRKRKRTGESDRVEIKPSSAQKHSIRRVVCAFSNDLREGETGAEASIPVRGGHLRSSLTYMEKAKNFANAKKIGLIQIHYPSASISHV